MRLWVLKLDGKSFSAAVKLTFGTELSSSNPISSADLHNFYVAFHFASPFPSRLVVSRPQKQHLWSVIKMFTLSQLQSILLECKFALASFTERGNSKSLNRKLSLPTRLWIYDHGKENFEKKYWKLGHKRFQFCEKSILYIFGTISRPFQKC